MHAEEARSAKLVDTSASFRDRYIDTDDGVTHSHGREGAHSHAGTAFSTWLDFTQAIEQAKGVRDALVHQLPEQSEAFTANFLGLESDLIDLDRRLTAIVARSPDKPLLASHPVYQYLARRYGLNLESLLWEPDAVAPPAEWQTLAGLLKGHPAEWMLWESDPIPDNIRLLEQLGLQSTVFDPCGNRPGNSNFLGVMTQNVENLERLFSR